ncbi:hypothetical protein HNP84_005408 [Thermocatellispora tengchongensis]|uniref:Uncharacterized protein n=1 Tax=Thermocatellispora tengchongensis TaxID=1073253 RepID=A0A840P303_9ACTN|nr:hypothetical protein [Thermocatellispora tengchongensis]MBB5135664.1 hypothetical protein [Thermocatellispora tengchongensis]
MAGPRGGPTNPLSDADIVTKSRTLTADVTPPTTWRRIESLVLGLDDLDDVTELVELLARPAHSLNIGL